MNKFYFVNVVTKDKELIKSFSKLIEEKYDLNILSGLNLAKMKDDSFLLAMTFVQEQAALWAEDYARNQPFDNVYTEEEQWMELAKIAVYCMIGNFTYNMIDIFEKGEI